MEEQLSFVSLDFASKKKRMSMASGYENSPDYDGGPLRPWPTVVVLALVVVVFLALRYFS
jgi:hypothetical protein